MRLGKDRAIVWSTMGKLATRLRSQRFLGRQHRCRSVLWSDLNSWGRLTLQQCLFYSKIDTEELATVSDRRRHL